MAEQLEELPLFPLKTVLFPYASLHLHVFEDRYREMVRSCVEYDRPFGIVLIREGEEIGETAEPYLVGTAVRIVKVRTHDDGRMDLQVQGERRFRIRRLAEDRPYLVGLVEPVIELEGEESARAHALVSRAREGFQMLIEGLIARPNFSIQVRFPTDPVVLSFTIANILPMENLTKQRLLETTDTLERIAGLIPILENHLLDIDKLRDEYSARAPNLPWRLRPADLQEWIQPN
jgi:Lon protease-like protein